jgi:hypothetical protein
LQPRNQTYGRQPAERRTRFMSMTIQGLHSQEYH